MFAIKDSEKKNLTMYTALPAVVVDIAVVVVLVVVVVVVKKQYQMEHTRPQEYGA